MKKTVRILSTLLALITIAACFAACANGKGDETKADQTTAVADNSGEQEVTTEEAVKSGIPKGLSYGDETINVLVWNDVEHEEFDSEGQTGEIINDAIYARNIAVEQMIGVTINNIRRDGNGDKRTAWQSHVKTVLATDPDTYDAVAGYSLSVALNATAGSLANLLNENDFPYLDLSQPYWSQHLQEKTKIAGKLFFASGDISRNALEMMYVCFVNKTILENHSLQNPQELVNTYEWTLEKFFEMCTGIYEGAGTKDEALDTFGYMSYGIHLDPWLYSSGCLICEPADDGTLAIAESLTSEKLLNTIEMFHTAWTTQDCLVGSSAGKHQAAFRDNRLLFCTERARSSHKTFAKNIDCKFYVVPTPLYDKDQTQYYTCMGNPYTLYAVTYNTSRREMAGAYLEAMAYQGYQNITPAVFELSLKTRYVDDPVSAEMYDIIREAIVDDPGRLWCDDLAGQTFFRSVISDSNASWESTVTATVGTLGKKLKNFNRKMASIEG